MLHNVYVIGKSSYRVNNLAASNKLSQECFPMAFLRISEGLWALSSSWRIQLALA